MRAPGSGKTFCIAILFWVATAVALSAQTYTTLWTFIPSEGNGPAGGGSLMQGLNGELIGQTGLGGSFNNGTLFEMVPNGRALSSLSFGGGCGPNCTAGQPIGSLLQAPNGTLYGVTNTGGAYVNGTVYQFTGSEGVSILHSFCPQLGCADGTYPTGGLVFGFTGKLYGITGAGGTGAACPRQFDPLGCGAIFEITPAGTFTTLYSFCPQAGCTDGASPTWALVLSTNGKFYGTTENGGIGNGDCVSYGCGTIFDISTAGTLTTLHRFCTSTNSNGFCTDGEAPSNGVIQGADGNFYGTTKSGGANGGGTVFKITPQGKLTTLYNFCSEANCLDGENPYAGLIQATDGNFYGTTTAGGAYSNRTCLGACGTIFEITPAGQYTKLHDFCSQTDCADGSTPAGALLQSTNGEFFGAALQGGNSGCTLGCGTLFSLATGLGPFVRTNPGFGKVGSRVDVLGNALTGATAVTFNGVAATFKVVSSTEITATVPTGATTGTIKVTTKGGTKLSSNVPFLVLP
jgi:uncharacterized repeat protein (TIGR03803 family)